MTDPNPNAKVLVPPLPPDPAGSARHDEPEQGLSLRWVLLAIGVSIIAGVLFDLVFGRAIPLRPAGIQEWLDGRGAWAPFVFIGVMVVAVVISPIPSVPLDIAAGLAFGLVWGTVYTLIGAEIGALIAFGLARRLGRPWLARRLPGPALRRVDLLTQRHGVRAILVMRLLPVFNFDWVSYAAGLTPIRPVPFALATLIGMIPPVIGIVAVGATLPDNPALAGVIFAVLVAAVFVPVVVPSARRWIMGTQEPARPAQRSQER